MNKDQPEERPATSEPATTEPEHAMSPTRAWAIYVVVRLLAFVIPFVVVYLLMQPWEWAWLVGALVGAVVSLAISEIFLTKERMAIGGQIQDRREERGDRRTRLDREEDALLDAEEHNNER